LDRERGRKIKPLERQYLVAIGGYKTRNVSCGTHFHRRAKDEKLEIPDEGYLLPKRKKKPERKTEERKEGGSGDTQTKETS